MAVKVVAASRVLPAITYERRVAVMTRLGSTAVIVVMTRGRGVSSNVMAAYGLGVWWREINRGAFRCFLLTSKLKMWLLGWEVVKGGVGGGVGGAGW